MRIALVFVAASVVACTQDFSTFESVETPDVAVDDSSSAMETGGTVDTGEPADTTVVTDTGTPPIDTGTPPIDTGTPPTDTGTPPTDTGTPPTDSGTDATDGGDAGVPCTEAESKTLAGHCYFPLTGTYRWSQASTQCTMRGAHLVTITSAAEQTLVQTIRPGTDRWIGLSRPAGSPTGEASFKRVTSEAVTYKNWATGEPNASGECARLQTTNQWGDRDCNQTETAICERE